MTVGKEDQCVKTGVHLIDDADRQPPDIKVNLSTSDVPTKYTNYCILTPLVYVVLLSGQN